MRLVQVLLGGMFSAILATCASATTWNVSPSGCDDFSCTPCCTIQGAVLKSSGGDIISIGPGIYPEEVDLRHMMFIGDITLKSSNGPGTVLISPPTEEGVVTSGFDTNTITIEGIDFTTTDSTCVWLAHAGDVFLRDITANDCGYSAFNIDTTGHATMERCTANSSARTGIQVDGASGAVLIDCTANSNAEHGIYVLNVAGAVDIVNPTTTGNVYDGTKLNIAGANTISGADVADNGRIGISGDVGGSVAISDSTVTGNAAEGVYFYWTGANPLDGITVTNTVANNNAHDSGSSGLRIRNYAGPVVIDDCDINNNGSRGVDAAVSGTIEILDSTITGNAGQGIAVDMEDIEPVDGVVLTNVDVSNNGHGDGVDGTRLRSVDGPVVLTDSVFDNNGEDGIFCDTSVVGNIEITSGRANDNGDDGYDLRVVGNATVVGVSANNNFENGIVAQIPGAATFRNCISNGNQTGSGLSVDWQEPDPVDKVSIIDCTANNNSLLSDGNGIIIEQVAGPVAVTGTTTNGNSGTGLRIDDVAGTVLIRRVESSFGLDEGFKVDADVGPVTVLDSIAEANATEGLVVRRENVDVETLVVRRSAFVANGGTGVSLSGLGGSGSMAVMCNDIEDNDFGLYLDSTVMVDARKVWWGNTTGPSSQGPGTGDGIYAEPGGTITFNPWLEDSFLSPVTTCEIFDSGFESGLIEEWDVVDR